MKIYQIHEYGGEWECGYDYIRKSYLSKEKAVAEKERMETEEELIRELSKKCHNCPVYVYTEEDVLIEEYCDKYKPYKCDDDDDEEFCENEAWNYEYSYFKIEEVEVIE